MHPLLSPLIIVEQLCIIMQDLPESQDTQPTSEQAVTQLSTSVTQLTLSPFEQRQVHRVRDELRDCALYSGVGVIYNDVLSDVWETMKRRLSALDYKIITADFLLHHRPTTLLSTIARSIAYPKPPAAAESSDSPPFVIVVFISGRAGGFANTLFTMHGSLDIVDDIIKLFLPQSAPHLQHIPKLFFISIKGDPHVPPPHFPDDPDGNYCVAYRVTKHASLKYQLKWAEHIADHLFLPGATVQEVIDNSKSHLVEGKELLHYFASLKNKLVLRK